jgi:hypothetical protein
MSYVVLCLGVIAKLGLECLTYGIPALLLLAVAAVAINAVYDLTRDDDRYR